MGTNGQFDVLKYIKVFKQSRFECMHYLDAQAAHQHYVCNRTGKAWVKGSESVHPAK